ncbi:MAG TPA: hypothetical protein VGF95_03410, partial [Solirubrobacteraceae bacterium]
MSKATNTKRIGMSLRRMLLFAVASLAALSSVAVSAQAAAPGWELLAATGPTHLPPEQSETQRITVEATGGTFTLSQTAHGEGHLSYAKGALRTTSGSREATLVGTANPFEAGQEVTASTGSRIALGAVIETVAGTIVTLNTAASLAGTTNVTATTKLVTNVTGAFHVGEAIAGVGIPAGTTVAAVNTAAKTLTLSQYPTQAGTVALSATQTTVPLPYDATSAELQSALEGLASFGAGAFSVTGGPGGDVEHPYFVTFTGSFADSKQALFLADSSGLEGEHAFIHVFVTVPGGHGTGEIGVYPANVGGQATNGEITLTVGPLPRGVTIEGPSTHQGWSCSAAAPETIATCTTSTVVNAIEPASPALIPVQVGSDAPASATIPVSVSGGGASEAVSYEMPFVVSSEPAQTGIAGFWLGAFDEDGKPETRAGAHPYSVANEILFNTVRVPDGEIKPPGDPRELLVDLPAGFAGDPLVTDRCSQSLLTEEPNYKAKTCNQEDLIGDLIPQTVFAGASSPFHIVNDIPVGGTAAEFSTKFVAPVQSLVASVRSEEDFGVRIEALNIPTFDPVFGVFTVFEGMPATAHGKAFFTNPTDCAEEAREAPVVKLQASSWQQPQTFAGASSQWAPVTGCDELEFQPEFSFQPTSVQGSSPVGATAHLHIGQEGLTDPGKLATPDLKESVVTLPEGFSINPSQANGLEACSEAQVGYLGEGALPNPTRFDEAPVTCPDASKLGAAEVSTPLLEEPLQGTVYLAAQEENPFHSLIALYLVIESKRFGVTLKLPGKVETNPETGQVTAVFDYVPQQPVEDLTLHFRGGGGRSEFATPEVCGTYTTTGSWTPWSAPESGSPAQTEDSFTVSSGCAATAAARPFSPGFEAGTTTPSAGSYSPLVIKLSRQDGEQELTHLNLTLPEGLLGKLAGVERCSDAAITAAAGMTGREELAHPSCSEASLLGSVDVAAGVGGEPLHVSGTVYLAGPYEGGPYSVVVITPAVAGPF